MLGCEGTVAPIPTMSQDLDPEGFAESLTWLQFYPGAAAIVAPQGLDFFVSSPGTVHAGFIAVPLSVAQFGVHKFDSLERTQHLETIIEPKKGGDADKATHDRIGAIKRAVVCELSPSQDLPVADVVLVSPRSIPFTASGKFRCSACTECHRLDDVGRLGVAG